MKWKSRLGYVVGAGKDCCLSTTFAAKQNNIVFFFLSDTNLRRFLEGCLAIEEPLLVGSAQFGRGMLRGKLLLLCNFSLKKKNSVQIGQINSEHGLSFLDFNLAR